MQYNYFDVPYVASESEGEARGMTTVWGEMNRTWCVSRADIYKFSKLCQLIFIDNYKSNKIKIAINEMMMNDSEINMRWINKAWSKPEICVSRKNIV